MIAIACDDDDRETKRNTHTQTVLWHLLTNKYRWNSNDDKNKTKQNTKKEKQKYGSKYCHDGSVLDAAIPIVIITCTPLSKSRSTKINCKCKYDNNQSFVARHLFAFFFCHTTCIEYCYCTSLPCLLFQLNHGMK